MCEILQSTTKAVDILEKMDNFFQRNNLSWNHVGFLCTDGAPSLLIAKSVSTTLVKKRALFINFTHSVLHRHALSPSRIPENSFEASD